MQNPALEQAVQFAKDHESTWDRDCTSSNWGVHHGDPAPYNKLYGPVHSRGPNSGTILLRGKTLTSWGEPNRADLTFSVAKTYLALLTGVAFDRGLIKDLNEPIGRQLKGIGFDQGNNALVTWEQMLQQTSEWEGTLFGLPDQVDRYRAVTFAKAPDGVKGDARPLQPAGTYWEYNDVRINQLSLALLHVFQRPLPEVFREAITRPVGATENWNWVGYDDAWVEVAGKRVQSVPGGTHWGGGMSISSEDQALIGQMMLDQGMANGMRVLSAEWIKRMQVPCTLAPFYGYLVWLNDQQKVFPSVPASSYFAVGAGSSFTWIEPEMGMVVIIRWLNSAHADAVFGKIYQAVKAIA
jgi:CubicO group peptidase (beta-lactamase class C family)